MTENDRHAVTEFRERIAAILKNRLVRLALFGSKAEGRDTPESDIDILVLIDDSAKNQRRRILNEAFEVNLKYGVYISPRIIPLSVYNDPVWQVTPFVKSLREKGIPL